MKPITGDDLLNTAQNIRMFECSKILSEWMLSNAAERPDRTRITSKNLHNLKGSATGAEGLRLVMERNAQNNAKEAAAADKREQAKQKKAVEVSALVTKGSAILKTLEQKGEAKLYRLKVDELVALLTHAYPQENQSKPKNKAEGLEKVRALGTVKVALERHALAVAVAQPPPVALETAPMPENYNILLRPSIGSVGSFDPVPTLAELSIDDVVPAVLLNASYADCCCQKVKSVKI